MEVGTAAVDITPPPGGELSGYVARVQPSAGILDRLKARALYLVQGKQRLLWLHLDLIGLENAFAGLVKQDLGRLTGLRPEAIVLSATHTHSGPATVHLNRCGEYDRTYMARLRPKLEEAAVRAMARTEPAALELGEAPCTLAVDRRKTRTPHTDPRMGVLAWRHADGGYAAVLANYAMHNVAFGAENRMISGDVAGRAAATLEDALPGAPLVLMTNGACGNLNPPRHVTTLREAEAWGEILAAAVLRGLAEASHAGEAAGIRTQLESVSIPLETGDEAEIHVWAEALRDTVATEIGYVPDRIRAAAFDWERDMLERLAQFNLPRTAAMDLHTLSIGPAALVCIGAEVFSLFTEMLRQLAPNPVYVVTCANGMAGYLPSPEAYSEGGYEVDSAFIYYNAFRPRRSAFDAVLERAANAATALQRQ